MKIAQSTIPGAGLGVFANRDFRKNECLGEYIGKFITPAQYEAKKKNKAYIWQLEDDEGDVIAYIDAGNKKYSNWSRYVNCPCKLKQLNVQPIQKNYQMFYYASRDITKGEELFVWYGPDYGEQLTGKRELE